jgi:hypothetical protein
MHDPIAKTGTWVKQMLQPGKVALAQVASAA